MSASHNVKMARRLTIGAVLLLLTSLGSRLVGAQTEPWSWQNPELAPNPNNNIHNDAWFTDTYTHAGPAAHERAETTLISEFTFADPESGAMRTLILGECAAHTYDAAGNLLTVCGGLPDPSTNEFLRSVAAISPAGELLAWTGFTYPYTNIQEALTSFGGAGYFFLDSQERIVLGMPDGHVVAWERQASAVSDVDSFTAVRDINITGTDGALAPDLGDLYALLPAENGYTWFTTTGGGVGTIAPDSCESDCVKWLDINDPDGDGTRDPQPDGNMQRISESHAVNGNATFQQSNYSMFRFDMEEDGAPVISWQETYDRGTVTKPGQTSQGSGTSPSYFELDGRGFVTIMDNATTPHINVYRAEATLESGESRLFATAAPFGAETQAAGENSLIVFPGSTSDSIRIYAENNWGNSRIINTIGPLAETQPGFGGIEVYRDGAVEVLAVNTEIRVPSVVSKGNSASNELYTYEKRATGWYLTALNPSDPRAVEWSVRVGGGAPRYNNWYAQLSLTPDGQSFNIGTLEGVINVKPVDGPANVDVCFAFLEAKDFIDKLGAVANWETGPTYHGDYLEAALAAWAHDIALFSAMLQGGTSIDALPADVQAELQRIEELVADVTTASQILASVGHDVTMLTAEQRATLLAIAARHADLIDAAFTAYALLCTTPDSAPGLPISSNATPISLEFSVSEVDAPDRLWVDERGLHIRNLAGIDIVSGDISGTATSSTNIGWTAPCNAETLTCRGAQISFQELTITDESGEWTGYVQLLIEPGAGADRLTGILVGRRGNTKQVLYLNEVVERSDTSLAVAGYRIDRAKPVGGVNLTFEACLHDATTATGGFLASHPADDSGPLQMTLTRGIDSALGLAVSARFEGQHGTMEGVALEHETTADGSSGHFVLLGGNSAYSGYLGFGRTGSQLVESDSCAGGYALHSFWIGEVYLGGAAS